MRISVTKRWTSGRGRYGLDALLEHCILTLLPEISARRSLSALACLDFRFLASQTGREGEGCQPLDDVCLQSNVSQRANVFQNFINEVFFRLLDCFLLP